MYNHHPNTSVQVAYSITKSARISHAFEFYIEADRDIMQGEEIFFNYGGGN